MPPEFTREEKLAEIAREIALRRAVYGKQASANGMKPEEAERRIAVMVAIANRLWGPRLMVLYTIDQAAALLRVSRRWLQDWLRDHPADAAGQPFYSPLGRGKTFDDSDLARIRATAREDERCRLNSSRRGKAARPTISEAHTVESMLTRAQRRTKKPLRLKSSKSASAKSNVVSLNPAGSERRS